MIEEIKKFNLFNKIFSIHQNEWQKVFSTFFLRFFYKASFVLAWTLVVTLFINSFGAFNLPFLFIINAFFTIIASLFYNNFLYKYAPIKLMIILLFISAFSIFGVSFLYSFDKNLYLFLLILIESVFLIQFKILLNAYIETIYTALESERIFPFTESAETIGAIVSGFLLFTLSNFIGFNSFLYIWVIFLVFMLPFLLFLDKEKKHIKPSFTEESKSSFFTFIKKEVFDKNKKNFLKGLIAIIFLQWFIYNLVEFQYVSALYDNVKNVVLDGGGGFEHAFIHDLGALFMLFNISALFCQLILASKLLQSLGIIGSMILHPIITFFSFTIFLFNNGFYPILFAKNNFMISSVVLNNSYHCSFYALKENIREFSRHFLEGIVRPVGALFGALFIVLLEFLFPINNFLFVNISILVISVILFKAIYSQEVNYFESAKNDLLNIDDLNIRKNAIEILAQKGGKNNLRLLISLLNKKDEKLSVKIKILEALGVSGELKVLKYIIKFLDSNNFYLRATSVDSLIEFFHNFSLFNKKHLVFRLELVSKLKQMYKTEKNDFLRVKIIHLLTLISGFSTLEFLMEILKGQNGLLKNQAIKSLSVYNNKNLEKVLLDFFKSGKADFQINACIALAKMNCKEKSVLKKIESFISSNDKSKVLLGIYAIGEIKLKSKKSFLMAQLYSNDLLLKKESAIALSKLGYYDSIPVLIELLFSDNIQISKSIKNSLKSFDKKVYQNLRNLLDLVVYEKINYFKKSLKTDDLSLLNKNSLSKLKFLYSLAEDFDAVENINKFHNK